MVYGGDPFYLTKTNPPCSAVCLR